MDFPTIASRVKPLPTACFSCAIVLAACGGAVGTEPHDMAAKEHDRVAAQHRAEAGAHASRYDPEAQKARERCSGSLSSGRTDEVCWTSVTNPTAEHRREAKEHARVAEEHRTASAALRDAERRACAGVAPPDRDMSPFEHREDIAGVEALEDSGEIVGVRVTFRQVPRLDAERLQRAIDCHLARNAALGHVVPEMPDCPLVPKGIAAKVVPASSEVSVEIRADTPTSAQESLARASSLLPAKATTR